MLAGVTVQAQRWAYLDGGQRVLSSTGSSETDAEGLYRIEDVPPGDYYVSIRPTEDHTVSLTLTNVGGRVSSIRIYAPSSGGAASDAVFPPTYFPGRTDIDTVRPLNLQAGMTLSNIEIARAEAVPAWSIRGLVVDRATGEPVSTARVRMMTEPFSATAYSWSIRGDSDGTFEITGIPAGRYRLQADVNALWGRGDSVPLLLEVNDSDIDDITLTLTQGFDIPARVVVDGEAQAGATLPLRLIGSAFGGVPSRAQPSGAPPMDLLTEDEFTIENVRPDDYRLSFRGASPGAYVESVRLGDRDVLADGLEIRGPVAGRLEFFVGTQPGLVEGTLLDARRDPAGDAAVVLAPETPGADRDDLYLRTITDTAGRFRFDSVAPGNYRVYACEDVPLSGAWRNQDYLDAYRALGEPVHVEEKGRVSVEVRVIPRGR